VIERIVLPLAFGIGGAAILVSLGVWQMQRLAWKEGILAEIEVRVAAPPVPLPETPEPETHHYLPVEVTGTLAEPHIRVLVGQRGVGAGYRIISPMEANGRRILVDRGFIRTDAALPPLPEGPITVTGNLHWPDEVDGFTPEPDLMANIWFARDVPALAAVLETEPVLLIARQMSQSGGALTPLPVDTSGIPNDHLNYAITWFSLALVWMGMTLCLLWRTGKRTV